MGLNEIKVAKVNDLKNGEMKAVSVGEGKEILLTKVDGSYNALGANCTHYSGPLAEGILCNGVIMCPLHHACFDAKTGNLLDPPARDSLPRYETKIVGDDVIVLVPDVRPIGVPLTSFAKRFWNEKLNIDPIAGSPTTSNLSFITVPVPV